jgi:hypothetical protein
MTTNATTNGPDEKETKISLEELASMTGFPIEMIQEEIFQGLGTEDVSLSELRAAMLNYIDSTMLMENTK